MAFFREMPRRLESLAKRIAALANSSGGAVVIGYDARSSRLVGIPHPQATLRLLETALTEIRPRPYVVGNTFRVQGAEVVAVEIPVSVNRPHTVRGLYYEWVRGRARQAPQQGEFLSELDDEMLRGLLRQPEGPRLEFMYAPPKDPGRLATTIAGFLNTEGGVVIVGYDNRTGHVVGRRRPEADDEVLRRALGMIYPPAAVRSFVPKVDGKQLFVISVPRGDRFPYAARGRVVRRAGASEAAITEDVIVKHLTERSRSVTVEERRLARMIEIQSLKIDQLASATSFTRQLPFQIGLVGGGAILGYVLGGWNPFGF